MTSEMGIKEDSTDNAKKKKNIPKDTILSFLKKRIATKIKNINNKKESIVGPSKKVPDRG